MLAGNEIQAAFAVCEGTASKRVSLKSWGYMQEGTASCLLLDVCLGAEFQIDQWCYPPDKENKCSMSHPSSLLISHSSETTAFNSFRYLTPHEYVMRLNRYISIFKLQTLFIDFVFPILAFLPSSYTHISFHRTSNEVSITVFIYISVLMITIM